MFKVLALRPIVLGMSGRQRIIHSSREVMVQSEEGISFLRQLQLDALEHGLSELDQGWARELVVLVLYV